MHVCGPGHTLTSAPLKLVSVGGCPVREGPLGADPLESCAIVMTLQGLPVRVSTRDRVEPGSTGPGVPEGFWMTVKGGAAGGWAVAGGEGGGGGQASGLMTSGDSGKSCDGVWRGRPGESATSGLPS